MGPLGLKAPITVSAKHYRERILDYYSSSKSNSSYETIRTVTKVTKLNLKDLVGRNLLIRASMRDLNV